MERREPVVEKNRSIPLKGLPEIKILKSHSMSIITILIRRGSGEGVRQHLTPSPLPFFVVNSTMVEF